MMRLAAVLAAALLCTGCGGLLQSLRPSASPLDGMSCTALEIAVGLLCGEQPAPDARPGPPASLAMSPQCGYVLLVDVSVRDHMLAVDSIVDVKRRGRDDRARVVLDSGSFTVPDSPEQVRAAIRAARCQ